MILNDLGYICNAWCFYKNTFITTYVPGTWGGKKGL